MQFFFGNMWDLNDSATNWFARWFPSWGRDPPPHGGHKMNLRVQEMIKKLRKKKKGIVLRKVMSTFYDIVLQLEAYKIIQIKPSEEAKTSPVLIESYRNM